MAPQLLLPIFDAGLSTAGYLDLLDAQRSLFLARQAVVQTRLLQLQNQVALYRTLGGGWAELPAPPTAPRAARQ